MANANPASSGAGGLVPGTLATLASTPAVIEAMFRGQPQEALERSGEEGWSAKDVLAHLLSMQPLALTGRVKAMLESELPVLPDVDENVCLEASGLRGRAAGELLQLFAESRAEVTRFLERLEPEDLKRRGVHGVAGEISVADAIHHMSYHDLLHIAQIANLLAEPMERSRGAMRDAFPV